MASVFTIDSDEEGAEENVGLMGSEVEEASDLDFSGTSSSAVLRVAWRVCGYAGPFFVAALLTFCYVLFLSVFLAPVASVAPGSAALGGFFFHLFFLLLCASFVRSVFSDAGSVPHVFEQQLADMEEQVREAERARRAEGAREDEEERASFQVSVGDRRFCRVCRHVTPERTHHCRFCERCVMKMEHHCPWLNNCVGHRTQKFFLLWLTYMSLTGLYTMVVTSVWIHEHGRLLAANLTHFPYMMLWLLPIVGGVCGVGILIFSLMHYYLVMTNLTTIEFLRRRGDESDNPYDLGSWYLNWKQVMGPTPLLWFIPVYSTLGSGSEWGAPGLLSEMG